MISHTAEYALRSVVWLASHPDRALSTQQISTATRVPAGYLSKVLQALARARLVVSNSGRGGGFLLARSPKRISVLDVINAVDGIERIRRCPLGLRSHGRVLCPLHKRLDDAMAMVEGTYASSTIAELLAESSASKPLCEGNSFVHVGTSAALAKTHRTQLDRSRIRGLIGPTPSPEGCVTDEPMHRCQGCGRLQGAAEVPNTPCGRCDKLAADAWMEPWR